MEISLYFSAVPMIAQKMCTALLGRTSTDIEVRSTPRLVVFIVRWLSVSQSFLTLRLKDLHETLFNILFIGIRCEYVHVYSVTVQAVLHWCMARARYCTSIFPHDA